jgi:hypothetical protein
VLPDHGAEAKGNELQQPLGDRGAQDKDFVGLPTGRDGAEVLGRRSLPVAIRFGAPGMSRQFFAPEAKAKGAEEIFEPSEPHFNPRPDTVELDSGDR